MIIPSYSYEPVKPPYPVPDSGMDVGDGPPPEGRTAADGPWLDRVTGILYVPQEVA